MPMTWNAEAEARLLLGILAQVKGVRLDYKALAAHMGPACSVAALHQHIFKLRRDAGIPASSPERDRVHPPGNTRKKSKRSASAQTPISRAKRPYCFIDDDDEDREDSGKDVKPIIKDEVEKKKRKKEKERSFVDLVD